MRVVSGLALVLAFVLAGCAGSPASDPVVDGDQAQASVYESIQAATTALPCDGGAITSDTSANFQRLGNASFPEAASRDIDIRGDLVLSPGGGGIGLVDVSDPRTPVILSELREIGGELDVKFSPDNQTALVGGGDGIILVDIRNPFNPLVEGYFNFSDAPSAPDLIQDPALGTRINAHMIYSARIADKDWVFLAPNANSGIWILELVGEPGNRSLDYVTQTLPVQGGPLGPHDMWVTYDAVEGSWLLYSADGFEGWTVFNIDDPTAPSFVGGLPRPETGYTHTIQAAFVDERRIVVTIQEVGANVLEVYDATVLRAPILLATWTLAAEEILQPQHNIQIVNGTLFVAHYSQGVYVFDLRDAGTLPMVGSATFAPNGHISADMDHPAPTDGDSGAVAIDFAGVYDVVLHEGLVYVSSYSGPTTGITTYAYGCFAPGNATLTSTG